MLLKDKFLATRTKILRKTDVAIGPLVFFRLVVVVTTGVGAVFRLISYFRNFSNFF